MATAQPHLQRVTLRHYKSIQEAVVDLDRLTLLVGPNGAGKSNFLDSLVFIHDCVTESVHHAFSRRGGISAVRRHSAGHPTNVGLGLTVALADGRTAEYRFDIAARKGEAFAVVREDCSIVGAPGEEFAFSVRSGEFVHPVEGIRPHLAADRLALPAVSALEEAQPLFDFISSLKVYSIVPKAMRELHDTDESAGVHHLAPDGRNAASILRRLMVEQPQVYDHVCDVLSSAVPGMHSVEPRQVGRWEHIEFRKDVGTSHPWRFEGLNASDGTLRLLGLLLAVYQPSPVPLLGIEEPETSVHPALAERILDVLRDAAATRQVIATTHSPDLLDAHELPADAIRYVDSVQNRTVISRLNATTRGIVRDRLYTVGELMRDHELQGDTEEANLLARQHPLF